MKKLIVAATLVTLSLGAFGCGQSESDRVVGATVEAACLAKGFVDEFNPETMMQDAANLSMQDLKAMQEKAQAKQTELQSQMEEILTKYGFANEAEFQTAAAKYENDEAMKTQAKEKAMTECELDLDQFQDMLGNI